MSFPPVRYIRKNKREKEKLKFYFMIFFPLWSHSKNNHFHIRLTIWIISFRVINHIWIFHTATCHFFAISDAAARARRTMEVLMKMRKFDKTSEWQKEKRNSFPEYFVGEIYSVNVEEVVTYITKFCVGEAINSARVRWRSLEKISSRVPKKSFSSLHIK